MIPSFTIWVFLRHSNLPAFRVASRVAGLVGGTKTKYGPFVKSDKTVFCVKFCINVPHSCDINPYHYIFLVRIICISAPGPFAVKFEEHLPSGTICDQR